MMLASFTDGDVMSTIALIAFIGILMVPRVIRTLTKHQQEMAEILRRGNTGSEHLEAEVRELRNQVSRLNQIVTDHLLAVPARSVQSRITEGEIKQQS